MKHNICNAKATTLDGVCSQCTMQMIIFRSVPGMNSKFVPVGPGAARRGAGRGSARTVRTTAAAAAGPGGTEGRARDRGGMAWPEGEAEGGVLNVIEDELSICFR